MLMLPFNLRRTVIYFCNAFKKSLTSLYFRITESYLKLFMEYTSKKHELLDVCHAIHTFQVRRSDLQMVDNTYDEQSV